MLLTIVMSQILNHVVPVRFSLVGCRNLGFSVQAVAHTRTAVGSRSGMKCKLSYGISQKPLTNASGKDGSVEEGSPTSKTKKADLRVFLSSKGIAFASNATVKELSKLCRKILPDRKRMLEGIIRGAGHEVLWLPPYHAHLNPIELVWGIVKRYLRDHVGRDNDYSDSMMRKILEEGLEKVTPEVWARCCEKTHNIVLELIREELPRLKPQDEHFSMIINLQDSDSDISVATDDEYEVDNPQAPTPNCAKALFTSESVDNVLAMKETEVLFHIPDDSGFEDDWFSQLCNDWENVGDVSTHMLTPSSPCSGVEPLMFTDCSVAPDEVEFYTETPAALWGLIPPRFMTVAEVLLAVKGISTSHGALCSATDIENATPLEEIVATSSPPSTPFSEVVDVPQLCVDRSPPQGEGRKLPHQSTVQFINVVGTISTVKDFSHLPKDNMIIIRNDVIRVSLSVSDLERLGDGQWLNDQIINYYFAVLKLRRLGVFTFSTFFYETLCHRGIDGVDVLSFDIILIPIHLSAAKHWVLCEVRVTEHRILCYDSLGTVAQAELGEKLQEYLRSCSSTELNMQQYSFSNVQNIQQNAYDCGVDVCVIAELRSRNRLLRVATKNNVPTFRQTILTDICSNSITELDKVEGVPIFPPPVPPKTETRTALQKVLLYQSATIHQRDKVKFPGRHNVQYTAIATYSIAKLCQVTCVPTRDYLNSIIEEGDKYYLQCVEKRGLQMVQLSCEDLLTSFEVNGFKMNISIDHIGEGQFKK
ncbi:Sentrin-specific protease, partial [Frankliniella fusca]